MARFGLENLLGGFGVFAKILTSTSIEYGTIAEKNLLNGTPRLFICYDVFNKRKKHCLPSLYKKCWGAGVASKCIHFRKLHFTVYANRRRLSRSRIFFSSEAAARAVIK
jgi:hypothetical protein